MHVRVPCSGILDTDLEAPNKQVPKLAEIIIGITFRPRRVRS